MLESLLLPHLNTALSAVFEDFGTHQLETSILGGSLVLRNLKIKRDAFAPLSLPIDVTYGHVGTLEIKLNLLRLLSEPIRFCAEGVLLVATTQPPSAWSVEREETLRDQQRSLILLTDECLTYAREESGLPSVLQRVVYALIQRIRLSVRGLELRLEDAETAPKQPFAIGLRASRLYNVQCDFNWTSQNLKTAQAAGSESPVATQGSSNKSNAFLASQSWFGWLAGFRERSKKGSALTSERIPECFHLKTVLEEASIYLDPLNDEHQHGAWLPYPASYRSTILKDLNELISTSSFSQSDVEASFPLSLGSPAPEAGSGVATPVSLRALLQTVEGRKQMTGAPVVERDEDASCGVSRKNTGGYRKMWKREFQVTSSQTGQQVESRQDLKRSLSSCAPSTVKNRGSPKKMKSFEGDNRENKDDFVRISDLFCPSELWRLASATAPNHFYILKPGEVEIQARCVQRPMAQSAESEKVFRRPSPSPVFVDRGVGKTSPEAAGKGEKVEGTGATAANDDSLPALSIIVSSRNFTLQFTNFQLASLCRWLHYAIILYQEVVSGVYAECLDLTPAPEEVQRYKCAWRRHLLAYALAACGSERPMYQQTHEKLEGEAFLAFGSTHSIQQEIGMEAEEDIIRMFETKYWPTIILPLRQQVLQKLQQEARFRQKKRNVELPKRKPVGACNSEVRNGLSKNFTPVCGERNEAETNVKPLNCPAEGDTVRMLMETVAGELAAEMSVTSEADLEVMKCIEQMRSQRISKSVHFAVEFAQLEVTLNAEYEAKECICIAANQLHAHIELYYDFRMAVVTAFEGVSVTDNLLPNLAHRQVLVSQPPPKRHKFFNEGPSHRSTFWGKHNGSSRESHTPCCEEAHSELKPFNSTTPPPSPLHLGDNACMLAWNSNCPWREGACPFDSFSANDFLPSAEADALQEAPASGWLRFEKVYIPINGLPDVLFHAQTSGSLLCTITPAAMAFLVQTLQEPVQLVERNSILEAASREVQEVMHLNELFMAKLLIGEIDRTSLDICVDIPASHRLLLPFNHKDPKSRGVLLQSGAISIDTCLQLPRINSSSFSITETSKAYDRYSAAITGACVQRVFSCIDIKKACSAAKPTPAFSPMLHHASQLEIVQTTNKEYAPGGSTKAGKRASALEEGLQKHKRWRGLKMTPAPACIETSVDASADRKPNGSAQTSMLVQDEDSSALRNDVCDTQQNFILWPVGVAVCVDMCHFSNPLNLPAFRLLVQDQAFRTMPTRLNSLRTCLLSGVCVSLTDGDLVALSGFVAEVLTVWKPLAALWAALPTVGDSSSVESGSTSRSSASRTTRSLDELKHPCVGNARIDSNVTKKSSRVLGGRLAAVVQRSSSSRPARGTLRFGASGGGLSSLSGRESGSSLPSAAKYSALKRVTLFLHRTLQCPGAAVPEGTSVPQGLPSDSTSTVHQQSAGRFSQTYAALEINRNTEPLPNASISSSGMLQASWAVDVKGEKRANVDWMKKGLKQQQGKTPGSASVGEEVTPPCRGQGLVGFDLRFGLSHCEVRLWKEGQAAEPDNSSTGEGIAVECNMESTCTGDLELSGTISNSKSAQNWHTRQPLRLLNNCPKRSDRLIMRCGMGGARLRVHSVARTNSCACLATLNQVYVTMGHPAAESASINSKGNEIKERSNAASKKHNNTESKTNCRSGWVSDLWNKGLATEPGFSSPAVTSAARSSHSASKVAEAALETWPLPLPCRFRRPVCFFAFTSNKKYSKNDRAAAAADAAAALFACSTPNGPQRLSMESPSVLSFTALQAALSSDQLRVTTRWMFPPPYPGEVNSDKQIFGVFSKLFHGNCRSSPVKQEYCCGPAGLSKSPNITYDPVAGAPDYYGYMAADDDVLLEDLAGGRSFLVPAMLHATVASRSTWQVLVGENTDVTIEASLCLKALLHTVDIRCSPLRVAVDWQALADLSGFAADLATNISATCGAVVQPDIPTTSDTAGLLASAHFVDPSNSALCLKYNSNHPVECSNGDAPNQNQHECFWEQSSLDERLFKRGGEIPPWRVRATVVIEHCEVIVPIITLSPYPDLPPSQASLVACRPTLAERDQRLVPSAATPFRRFSGRNSLTSGAIPLSSSLLSQSQWCRAGSNAQQKLAGSKTASRQNEEFIGGAFKNKGKRDMLETLVTVSPPVFAFSCSLSISYYSECRSIFNTNGKEFCRAARCGRLQPLGADFAVQQTINRLLGSVQKMHLMLLQPSEGQEEGESLSYLVDMVRRMHLSAEDGHQSFPKVGQGCLRPPGFGTPDAACVTLLDVYHHMVSIYRNEIEEPAMGTASSGSLGLAASASGPSVITSNTHVGTKRTIQGVWRKTKKAQTGLRALQRQTVIDGCRFQLKAFYKMNEPSNSTVDIFSLGNQIHPSLHANRPEGARLGKLIGEGEKTARHASSSFGSLSYREAQPTATLDTLVELDPVTVCQGLDLRRSVLMLQLGYASSIQVNLDPAVVVGGASLVRLLESIFVACPSTDQAGKQPPTVASDTASNGGEVDKNGDEPICIGQDSPQQSFVTAQSIESFSSGVSGVSNASRLRPRRHDKGIAAGSINMATKAPCNVFGSSNIRFTTRVSTDAKGRELDGVEDTTSFLSWLWALCHSLETRVLVKIKGECIQLASPYLQLTFEDLDIRAGLELPNWRAFSGPLDVLEDLQYKGAGKRLRNVRETIALSGSRLKAGTFEVGASENIRGRRGRKHVGLVAPNDTIEGCYSLAEAAGWAEGKENKLFLSIYVIIFAEALQKARMALESVLEPWSCTVNIKYTPGDVLLKTLPVHPLERGGTRQVGDKPAMMRRATAAFMGAAHVSGRHHFPFLHGKARTIPSPPAIGFPSSGMGEECTSREHPSWAGAQMTRTPFIKCPENRNARLQQLAKVWGKNGAELYGEVDCSWMNVTIAPFLMDAVLETSDIIEAAQRSRNAYISMLLQLGVALRNDAHSGFFDATKGHSEFTGFIQRKLPMTHLVANSATPMQTSDKANNDCCSNLPKHQRSNETLTRLPPSSSDCVVEGYAAGRESPTSNFEAKKTFHGAALDKGESSFPHREPLRFNGKIPLVKAQEALHKEDQPMPLLVNLTGHQLAVRVPKPVRASQEVGGERSISFSLSHLATNDFGTERQSAFRWFGEDMQNREVAVGHEAHTKNYRDESSENKKFSEKSLPRPGAGDTYFTSSCSSDSEIVENKSSEWMIIRHEECFPIPLDDHGQILKVTVRLQLMGSEFEISDLKLDATNIAVRSLPLKIPSAVIRPASRDPRKRIRHEMLASTVRVLVRTVFMPDTRTFNTYLSSMITIRNNSDTSVLVFPHPAVALLDSLVDGIQSQSSSCSISDREEKVLLRKTLPLPKSLRGTPEITDAEGHYCSPDATEAVSAETWEEGTHDGCESTNSVEVNDYGANRCWIRNHGAESDISEASPSCPLEVLAHGGVAYIPLSWILPRAFVAHGLQCQDTENVLCVHPSHPPHATTTLTPLRHCPPDIPAGETTGASFPKRPSVVMFSELEAFQGALQRNSGQNLDSNKYNKEMGSVSVNVHQRAFEPQPPPQRSAGERVQVSAHKFWTESLEAWREDITVESLFVIPTSCFTAAVAQKNQRRLLNETAEAKQPKTVLMRNLTSLSNTTSQQQATGSRRFLRRLTFNKQASCSVQPSIYETVECKAGYVAITMFQSYHDLYYLARSLGAKPLLHQTTFQRIAMGTSQSVLSYDCQPQVLEFLSSVSPQLKTEKSDSQVPSERGSFDRPTQDLDIREGPGVSTVLAVTVYGKSRDLVSESDPLFFEVGLNAPISLGNRLFEPIRVHLVTSPPQAHQRMAASSTAVAGVETQGGISLLGDLSAGEDVDIQKAANGFVFELETTGGSTDYRHVYVSKPVLIDCYSPAPVDALDMTVYFARTRILDAAGNRVQQHSLEYRRLARHQPVEFSVLAEVLGWVQQNFKSTTGTHYERGGFPCDHAGLTNIKTHMWSTCVRTIRIFAPFWLVNRQPEPLFVSYCHRTLQYMAPCDWRLLGVPSQGKALLALGVAQEGEAGHLPVPLKDSSASALADEVAAARSWRGTGPKLCAAFRTDIVGRPTAVSVPNPSIYERFGKRSSKKHHLFGVTVALAPPPFSRSKIISIYSRFVLKNTLPGDLWVKENIESSQHLRIEAGSQCTFHPQIVGPRGEALICITTTDPEIIMTLARDTGNGQCSESQKTRHAADGKGRSTERTIWSSQLSISRSSTLQIRIKNPVEAVRTSQTARGMSADSKGFAKTGRSLSWKHQNIQITIHSVENASFVVVFSEPATSDYLLVNNTNHLIAFAQSGVRDKNIWELLGIGQQVDYAWSDPQRERKHLRLSFWDCNQQVVKSCDIARVRVHRPLTLPNSKEKIYLITDVCGSRRRVTVTTAVPFATGDTAAGGRSTTWKGLQNDIFRFHRRRPPKTLRKRCSDGLLTKITAQQPPSTRSFRPRQTVPIVGNSESADWGDPDVRPSRSVRWRSALDTMSRKRVSTLDPNRSVGLERATETDATPQQMVLPKKEGGFIHGSTPAQKLLRFQPGEQKLSGSSQGGGSVKFTKEDSLDFMGFNDAFLKYESPDKNSLFRGSKGSVGGDDNVVSRRHRLTAFVQSHHGTIGASGTLEPRSSRASVAPRVNRRRTYILSHRRTTASSSSEMTPDPESSNEKCMSEIGLYVCLSIRGFGLSLVDNTPQELAFIGCSGICAAMRRLHGSATRDFRFSMTSLQIDNGVAGAQHQTILRHTTLEEKMEHHGWDGRSTHLGDGFMVSGFFEGVPRSVLKPSIVWDAADEPKGEERRLFFRFQLGGEWLPEATLLEYVYAELAPIALHLEADTAFVLLRFLMQLLQNRNFFLRSLQERNVQRVRQAATEGSPGYQELRGIPAATAPTLASLKPLYIHSISFCPMLIILSTRSQRLQRRHITTEHDDLVAIRHFEVLGDRMTDITNFPLKSRLFFQQCLFTTSEQLTADIGTSYIQQCIRQLHKLVASIDVIGNPLRLITGVVSSMRALTAHPFKDASASDAKAWAVFKCMCTLLLNLTSEVFASLSNIAGGLLKLFEVLGLIDLEKILCFWPESMRVPRMRIERPETFAEGWSAGSLGGFQVLAGSIFAVGAIPVKRMRESGCMGFCAGVLQGISSLVTGAAVTCLVIIVAVSAGISAGLRHKSIISKTRPPRVFPPHLEVSAYALHAAQAMSLLERSTKKNLMPGTLQFAIEAVPLYHIRLTRPRVQQFTLDDKRPQVKDYLIVTPDLLVCLRDGEAEWVCRTEDIDRCTVKVPAFLMGAFQAHQDHFLRYRERGDIARAHEWTPPFFGETEYSPHAQGNLYTVQITVKNQLQLPDKVLRNFSLAYKAYVSHATNKRSVVRALKKRLKLRGGTSDQSIPVDVLARGRTSTEHVLHEAVPATLEAGAFSSQGRRQGVTSRKKDEEGKEWSDGATSFRNRATSDTCSIGEGLSAFRSLLKCQRRRREWSLRSHGVPHGLATIVDSVRRWRWLDWHGGVHPPAPPEAVTLHINASESGMALRIFDVVCSLSEGNRIARDSIGVNDSA